MRKWLYDCSAELIEDPLVFILTSSVFAALASILVLAARLALWVAHGHWYSSICDAFIFLHRGKPACLEEDPGIIVTIVLWFDPSLSCLAIAIALLMCAVGCIALSLLLGWLSERLGYRP
ncbi:hypothetical protein CO668_30850 [Rhizobium anhuiense]|nr:hypothetical protein CO668_30850 [Rhizobium anhuiense]